MKFTTLRCWPAFLAATLIATSALHADEPIRIVFQGGRSLPIEAVSIENGKVTVKTAQDGFTQGQTFDASLADHIYGERPAALNKGIALILMDKSREALAELEPIVASQKVTAGIPGNFWLEAARATTIAQAIAGTAGKWEPVAKEITAVTPGAGNDPVTALAKALTMPLTVKLEDRLAALADLSNDTAQADIAAYASFFRGNLLKKIKGREADALEAFNTISCLYPTGGSVLNGAGELNAADFLRLQNRRTEAVALLTSAARSAKGTAIADDANKRLESLK